MIVVTVMYPAEARFDVDYYRDQHLPLVRRVWGEALLGSEPLRSVATADGSAPPMQVITLLRFSDMATLQQAMAEHGAEVMADLQNFTDAQPIIQINETI